MSEIAPKPEAGSLARLRESARTLFVARGYHNTRPQDIAREAGLGNGTFYLHFGNKKEAFLDFAGQAQAQLLDEVRGRLDGVADLRARWRVIFEVIADYAGRNPGVLQAAFLDPVFVAPDEAEAWDMYDRMGRFVNLALVDGDTTRIEGEYDLELISHAVCGMLRHALIFAARKDVDRDRMIDDLSMFIDRGLGLDGRTEKRGV